MYKFENGPVEHRSVRGCGCPRRRPGQHNLEVYTAELGYSHGELVVMKECGVV